IFLEKNEARNYIDSSSSYLGSAINVITAPSFYDCQTLVIDGDGYEFEGTCIDGSIPVEAHGAPVDIGSAQWGFRVYSATSILPPVLPGQVGFIQSNSMQPYHVSTAYMYFTDTVAGT